MALRYLQVLLQRAAPITRLYFNATANPTWLLLFLTVRSAAFVQATELEY